MLRFKYCKTHLEDEEYMNKMSSMGWHTKRLVEGFWLFTKGQPISILIEFITFVEWIRKVSNIKLKN